MRLSFMKNILIEYLKKWGIFLTFIVILSVFFSQDFFIFQEKQNHQLEEQKYKEKLNNFSLAHIPQFENVSLRRTPDESFIQDIVLKISKTRKNIYLNSYIFTEKRIKKALIEAGKRGVDVKVILEKNVYNAPNVNKATYEELKENNIPVVWSASKNFSLNHAKYIVFDDVVLVSTWNYSYSNFTKKRDLFLYVTDATFLKNMVNLFENDFSGEKTFFNQDNVVLSSYDARWKLSKLIQESQSSILMYAPYLQDDLLISLLKTKIKDWINIKIVTNVSEKSEQDIKDLIDLGLEIVFSPLEIHAKSIDVDGKVVYIGSINFSTSSIDKNREVWLLISHENIIKQFEDVFYRDFHIK